MQLRACCKQGKPRKTVQNRSPLGENRDGGQRKGKKSNEKNSTKNREQGRSTYEWAAPDCQNCARRCPSRTIAHSTRPPATWPRRLRSEPRFARRAKARRSSAAAAAQCRPECVHGRSSTLTTHTEYFGFRSCASKLEQTKSDKKCSICARKNKTPVRFLRKNLLGKMKNKHSKIRHLFLSEMSKDCLSEECCVQITDY